MSTQPYFPALSRVKDLGRHKITFPLVPTSRPSDSNNADTKHSSMAGSFLRAHMRTTLNRWRLSGTCWRRCWDSRPIHNRRCSHFSARSSSLVLHGPFAFMAEKFLWSLTCAWKMLRARRKKSQVDSNESLQSISLIITFCVGFLRVGSQQQMICRNDPFFAHMRQIDDDRQEEARIRQQITHPLTRKKMCIPVKLTYIDAQSSCRAGLTSFQKVDQW